MPCSGFLTKVGLNSVRG